ncbi:MAG TPA: carboxypeptidase-like regulatory domain-containing protein [Chryseosolibacter sp.]
MKKLSLIAQAVVLIPTLYMPRLSAQDLEINRLVSISGTVVDAETSEALSFASVAIRNKAQGTITNSFGAFDLTLRNGSSQDTLAVSMMGYQPLTIPIGTNFTNITIRLRPQALLLKEVEVTGKRITTDEIFAAIKARIKTNYPVDDYAMECFYREIKKENETYRSLLEAALVIRDKGYDKATPEVVYLREVRGSSKFINRFSDFWQRNNLLNETLGLNAVRHPSSAPSVVGGDRYQLEGTTMLNAREVYVLTSEIKPDDCWQRTLYVDVETYAIYRSEEAIRNFALSWKVDNNDSVSMRLTKGSSMFDFKVFNGKLYLSHIRHEVENEYFNPKTNVTLQRFTIINDLVVSDIYDDAKSQTEGLKRVDNRALELQVTPYNEIFWDQYNGIKQTPLESKIMSDLLRDAELTEQFKESAAEKSGRRRRRHE